MSTGANISFCVCCCSNLYLTLSQYNRGNESFHFEFVIYIEFIIANDDKIVHYVSLHVLCLHNAQPSTLPSLRYFVGGGDGKFLV